MLFNASEVSKKLLSDYEVVILYHKNKIFKNILTNLPPSCMVSYISNEPNNKKRMERLHAGTFDAGKIHIYTDK